ncbi:MAG: helix-turn-helix transcriptional regulator [Calditrichaeota bacterium]|nr:helix-turn-helix transcriptional regulator [Calditrichota bacterium]
MKRLIDFLATKLLSHKTWIIGIIIFLVSTSISFYATSEETYWLWADYPLVAVIFVLLVFLMAAVYLRIEAILHQQELEKVRRISSDPMQQLSFREQEVVKLILNQKNNQEIADELHVELSTIKTHINRIYKELGVKNRKELLQLLN